MTSLNNKILYLCLSLILLTTACGLKQTYPDKSRYGLNLTQESAPNKIKPKNILVGRFNSDALYGDRSLVYKVGENKFKSDYYNEFTLPLNDLLAENSTLFLNSLTPKILFFKTPGFQLADYGLQADIEKFYGDYSNKEKQSVISITFTLFDLRKDKPVLLFNKNYQDIRPLQDDSTQTLIKSYENAMDSILKQLYNDINKHLK